MDKRLIVFTLIAILGLGIAVKLNKHTEKVSKKSDNWGEATPTVKPPIEESKPEITIAKSYEDALKLSAKLGKPILLVFKTTNCQYCKMMEQNVWNKPEINKALVPYVFYKVNLDVDSVDYALGAKYAIDGVPAFKIIDCKEKVLKSDKGYKDLKKMIEWLDNPNLYKQEIEPEEPEKVIPKQEPEQPEHRKFKPFKRK